MKRVSLKEGGTLVKLARESISTYFSKRKLMSAPKLAGNLAEKGGVFVTIETYPKKSLRGCIGYIEPVKPLAQAVVEVAVSAAFSDRRFHELKEEELDKIIIEVTVLSPPELLKAKEPAKDYPKQIEIGKHGLIVEYAPFKGVLLPQVAVDNKWDPILFLEQTCWKAKLSPDMWMDEGTRVYRFEGQWFAETKPGGKVVEKKLG
jgi:uncharacterized protein (TIGR00296 family)